MSTFKDRKYDRVLGLAWQMIDDCVLILEPKSKRAHELNPVASFIWEKLDGECSVDEMVESVAQEYDIDRGLIEEEVLDFFATLARERLISECLR